MKNPFRRITPEDVAVKELEQSKLMVLQYESAALYNQAMAKYYRGNIERLEEYLRLADTKHFYKNAEEMYLDFGTFIPEKE